MSRPTSRRNCLIASKNGTISMSPTVPPISTMTTSMSSAANLRHAFFDFVRHVGNYLHRLSEVVASTLLGDDSRVDEPCSRVGVAVKVLVDEPLVMAEIQVRLAAVLGDEDLAMLEGVHRPGVHVYVRVELDHRDPQIPAFEESSQRGRGEALAERGRDTASDEDVLTHASTSWCTT